MSVRRSTMGAISLAVASCLADAGSAGGTDLAAARALEMSGPGIGELACLPSAASSQSVIAGAATGPVNPDAASPVETLFRELVRPCRPGAPKPAALASAANDVVAPYKPSCCGKMPTTSGRATALASSMPGPARACSWSRARPSKWTSAFRPIWNGTAPSRRPASPTGSSCWSSSDSSAPTHRKATTS